MVIHMLDCMHTVYVGCALFVFVTIHRQWTSFPKKPIKRGNSLDAADLLKSLLSATFLRGISESLKLTCSLMKKKEKKEAASVEAHQL